MSERDVIGELQAEFLAISTGMFNAIGVLQRDAPAESVQNTPNPGLDGKRTANRHLSRDP